MKLFCKECKVEIEKKECWKCDKMIKNCKRCLKKGLERRYQIYLDSLSNSLSDENRFIIKSLKKGIEECDKLDLCWYCFD